MDFTLLFTRNTKQGILRHFSSNEAPTNKIIDLAETKEFNIQGLIFSDDLKNDDFISSLENEIRFFPVRSNSEFGIDAETFEKLSFDEGKKIFDKLREHWILQNNISLIEELFKVRNHLAGLWPNDRSGFFEELWFLLKSNLGASNLVLIYNDMIKSKNENEKNKLVKVKVQGERYPELTSINDIDEQILKSYEKEFGNQMQITDFNKEKGQLVICGSIKKSPVFVMANIYQLSRLQKALLSSLFDGLNL
jgi:hypothetical protein